MLLDEIDEYLLETESIEGWVFPVDACLFALIDEAQQARGIVGNLFEIGVHHGKTALLLDRMRRAGERIGFCDVFGQQDLNIDDSGRGNLAIFSHNLKRFARAADTDWSILAKPSDHLTTSDTSTQCRFFHIDGGHTASIVESDIATAHRAISTDGVIVLDDVFHPSWPGVVEGLFRYLNANPGHLAPLIIGGNKVYLCKPNAVPHYEVSLDELRQLRGRVPYAFDRKDWIGRSVLTAIRPHLVDLNPIKAAREHYRPRSLRGRLLKWLLSQQS